MANILIKSSEKAAGIEPRERAVKENATIIVDGAPKYTGEYGKGNHSGIGLLAHESYHIKDLSGQLLVSIKSSGVVSPSIEFQMGDKSLAVMKVGGLLCKNPVLYLKGHEYYLPKPDPKNGHFKIENWSFQFNDKQEMLISKPNDGKNLTALAIGYYFWVKKKDPPAQRLH
jgi:hypothetical protein